MERIYATIRELEDFECRWNSDIKINIDDEKRKVKMLSSSEIKKVLDRYTDENRVLRIGIIGRIKVGKSSFLNTLFFDGQSVLPEAATPMTATLNILKYSEQNAIEIEFFSQSDIEEFRRGYEIWEKKVRELENVENRECAKHLIKERFSELTALAEQWEEIKKTDWRPQRFKQKIEVDTEHEIRNLLKDYVGVDGRYTPFTKSITLFLNKTNLKDIEIIDTPGINDPIISREQKTKDCLRFCDVVFVLSASSNFLTEADALLIKRINHQEKICYVYLIASKFDMVLDDRGLIRDEEGSLPRVIESIKKTLESYKSNVIQTKHIDEIKNAPILLFSNLASSFLQKSKRKDLEQSDLDFLDKLKKSYPDFFQNDEYVQEWLKRLGDKEEIENILREIRTKKDEICQKKQRDYLALQYSSVMKFMQSLEKNIQEERREIEKIQSDEIRQEEEQKKEMETKRDEITDMYEDWCKTIVQRVIEDIKNEGDEKLEKVDQIISKERGKDYDYWFFGEKIDAWQIRKELKKLQKKLIEYVSKFDIGDHLETLRKKTLSLLLDKNNPRLVKSVFRIIENISLPQMKEELFDLTEELQLKGKEATNFLIEANRIMEKIEINFGKCLAEIEKEWKKELEGIDYANEIVADYNARIESIKEKMTNRELTLKRYDKILKELHAIQEQGY